MVVPADVETVWELLVDDESLSAWLGGEALIDAVPGGRVALVGPDGDRVGVVDEVVPERRLAFTWCAPDDDGGAPSTVEFDLEPAGDETVIRIREMPVRVAPVSVPHSGEARALARA